jgi:hypothetical protein
MCNSEALNGNSFSKYSKEKFVSGFVRYQNGTMFQFASPSAQQLSISISYAQPKVIALLVITNRMLFFLMSSAAQPAQEPACFGSAVSSISAPAGAWSNR